MRNLKKKKNFLRMAIPVVLNLFVIKSTRFGALAYFYPNPVNVVLIHDKIYVQSVDSVFFFFWCSLDLLIWGVSWILHHSNVNI